MESKKDWKTALDVNHLDSTRRTDSEMGAKEKKQDQQWVKEAYGKRREYETLKFSRADAAVGQQN